MANVPFVAFLTSASSVGERLGHHLVDLGHFCLLGALAALLRALSVLTAERFALGTLVRGLLGVVLTTPIALWALREDVAGFLERMQVPSWVPARLLIALGFAVAYVAFSLALSRIESRVPVWASAAGVAALVAVSNLVLPPDYPGIHLFVLSCAARAGALGASRVLERHLVSRGVGIGLLSALIAGCIASVAIRPPASVWRRVFDVPSSVAPNLFGRILAPTRTVRASWVPPENAAWFVDRKREPPRPATAHALVPKNAIVVILTVDALRADVALGGEHDEALPAIARARRTSIRFVNARSPSPSTLTTAMALFTGKYYSQTYWTKSGNSVLPTSDESARFPALLSKRGVRTVHAIALRGLSKKTGVGRGFERERQTKRDYGRARDLMNIVIDEVKDLGDLPGFVFAHFVDSHAPYNLAGKEGSNFERYLGELALVDREIRRLQSLFDRDEYRERAVLVVSADHGEAFGEHGMNYHARSVYEELLHVPLFVRLPGAKPRDVAEHVSLIDLGPTVLDLFGLSTPGDFMGESLVPLLAGETAKTTRPLAADSGRRLQALLFPDGVKAIRDLTHSTAEVYDLKRDPQELENLMDDSNFPAERYAAALEEFFEVHTLERRGWEPPWRKF
jgi:arylsulfatase A-like enzyme